jgi:membrane protein DedA with SNARE-associated domain
MPATMFFLFNIPDFAQFIERFGYIGIFIWFVTFDQFTPFPEEISLLIIGYLIAHHIFHPVLAGVFCLLGFICVDTIYYLLSKTGSKLIKRKSQRSRSSFVASYRKKLEENMPKTLVILCFIPRMRMWSPILAGSMKLPFKKFLLFDTLGLCLFTTVYLLLGIVFHKSLSTVMAKIKGLQNITFFSAALVIAIVIIILVKKRQREKKEPTQADQ